jgi:hypothetical protein
VITTWIVALTVAAAPDQAPRPLADVRVDAADALVVLSRHSGEVLRAEGATQLPLPFGSTLTPFLVAGATSPTPVLQPDRARPGWRCNGPEGPVDASTALQRSCDGWFLDWAAREPAVLRLGAWGPPLRALGLSALPSDAMEAIGVRPSLRFTALGLAGAYRLLAEARPDLVDLLSRSASEGTLCGLEASAALSGVAVKTGAVLDSAARPRLGWLAALDRDVVVVMARAGRTPRALGGELLRVLATARADGLGAARVQVFGLLAPGDVTARCPRRGFVAGAGGPLALEGEVPLASAVARGAAVCVGAPWLVRVAGGRRPRPYAGVFTLEPVGVGVAPARGATAREARARRGSDIVFRTTRLLYAAGVVAAEDAAARGEVRVALARVADANGRHPRHPGRPVCDTTHCQAFLGTARPGSEERRALARPLEAGWLPFSRGGEERWTEARPRAAVERVLGPGARGLAFGRGRVRFVASDGTGRDLGEERREVGCEVLRGPLELPSCPDAAVTDGDTITFRGRGAGHGEGLDLEWARQSGLPAEAILERSYGRGER